MTTLDVFTPPRAPTPNGSGEQAKPRTITTNFGDGYNQTVPDGSNPMQRAWTFVWDPIERTNALAMVAFLEAHIGQPFYFTVPGEVAPRTVTWTGFSRSYPYPSEDALTVQMQEWFVY